MRITLIFVFVVFLFTIACKKEDAGNNIKDKIVVGFETGLRVTNYDTVLVGGYYAKKAFDLDVNGDKIPDFQFTSEIWGSQGLGQIPQSRILCLNTNCLVNGFDSNDTTFLNYRTQTINAEDKPRIHIYNTTSYSCMRIGISDSIVKITPNQFKLLVKSKGDYLEKSESFKSDTVTLSDEWYSSRVLFPIVNGDTAVYNYTQSHYTCNSFPQEVIQYIGIKITAPKNNDKIGWIKLSISNNYKISILESAIQK